jgi:hypothetical protein
MFKIIAQEKETDQQPFNDGDVDQEIGQYAPSDYWAHLPQAGFPLSYATPGHHSMAW